MHNHNSSGGDRTDGNERDIDDDIGWVEFGVRAEVKQSDLMEDTQLQLTATIGYQPLEVPYSTITTEGTLVPLGLSKARHVWADDGLEYLAKHRQFGVDSTPYGPANELIAALLAREIGLPINGFGMLRFREALMFGSQWIPEWERTHLDRPEKLAACVNHSAVYGIASFDIWLCNPDRHHLNIIVRRKRRGKQDHRELVMIDHDRCLMPNTVDPTMLADTWNDASVLTFLKNHVIRYGVTDPARLSLAIRTIESLSTVAIGACFDQVPTTLLARPDRKIVESFVVERQGKLREMILRSPDAFPHLEGAVQ